MDKGEVLILSPEVVVEKMPSNGESVANDTHNGKAEDVSNEANGNSENGTAVPSVVGFTNVSKDDAQQYLNNYKAHRTGITHEEMVRVYTEWANNYDKVHFNVLKSFLRFVSSLDDLGFLQDLCPGRYNGPEIAARFMAQHYPESSRGSVKILDVAAGTGRVGFELHGVGFR
jgi:hypothetical protein